MNNTVPKRIWIDMLNIPDSHKYAGTYYLGDDEHHATAGYVRADIHATITKERDELRAEVERLHGLVTDHLASSIADDFAGAEADAFINGDGTEKPRGIFNDRSSGE